MLGDRAITLARKQGGFGDGERKTAFRNRPRSAAIGILKFHQPTKIPGWPLPDILGLDRTKIQSASCAD